MLRSLASNAVDPLEIARDWTARLARGLEAAIRVRSERALPSAQAFDIHFPALMADPIAMVRRIYAHFDMPLSADALARMQRFLAANPSDKHGAHRYTLAASGLDLDTERRRYAAYQAHFGIASETTS